jgi:hypothetical protein
MKLTDGNIKQFEDYLLTHTKDMEKIEYSGITIIKLYLQKLELLNDRERATLIGAIELINTPLFIANL